VLALIALKLEFLSKKPVLLFDPSKLVTFSDRFLRLAEHYHFYFELFFLKVKA
jgi:hypothetical protein